MIPYGRQHIDDADIQAVVDVLKSDWLTQGPAIESFEKALAKYCGAKYAVAVSSATAALHIACLAAGVGPGKTVWTVPNTFVASANCALYCGGGVDFVDIDSNLNISIESLEMKLSQAKAPDVIIPVHFSGRSASMEKLHAIARKHNIVVIEDASHAIGASQNGAKVGSCKSSDMCVFSFHPVKIITTGEGGMVTTNSDSLYQKLIRLRTHGITRDSTQMKGESEGPWYYQQIELGYNYRITDIQAALGLSQLNHLDKFVSRRRELVNRYHSLLAHLPVVIPQGSNDHESAWHLYVVRLKLDQIQRTRREVFEAMRAHGIAVNVHYIPVHLQPFYQAMGFRPGAFPVSEQYYEEALSLPLFYDLTFEDQDRVVAALKASLA
ncbi:MAG: UDP-4-amino-4,6-dideoxy-N-acetyl-beta-L-altrosamine transaminase [Leptospirales bacterium]|nr:UDP-4-amino-4,6-dideoxy-N-acetyl-beta-L-altrosamine transaminase [Leptospirales bacterium]